MSDLRQRKDTMRIEECYVGDKKHLNVIVAQTEFEKNMIFAINSQNSE